MLLKQPQLALLPDMPQSWRNIESPGTDLLIKLLELIQNHPNLKSVQIIERWHGTDEYRHLNKLAATDLLAPENGMDAEFLDTLNAMEKQVRVDELNALLEKAKNTVLTETEKRRLNALLTDGVSTE